MADQQINEIEYNFSGILDNLNRIAFHRLPLLQKYEQNIYAELNQIPENVCGLIVLLQNQRMQGNLLKARALAHKIWNIGGSISRLFELSYIDSLLSLGMLDMALVLLKPRLENISANTPAFTQLFLKFAIMTGNINLLEKITVNNEGLSAVFGNFIAAYRALNYVTHFNNIQKIVIESIGDRLLSYEFNLYFDRGFTDLETILYVNDPAYDAPKLAVAIGHKIDAYCLSAKIKRLHNYQLKTKNIAEHPAIYADSDDDQEDINDTSPSDWGL